MHETLRDPSLIHAYAASSGSATYVAGPPAAPSPCGCWATPKKHWPQLAEVQVICRSSFPYVTGVLRGTEQLPLFRLHYGGSAHSFGFAIYSAARGRCEDAVLLTGLPVGTPQEAACSTCAPLFGITLVPNANSSRSQFRPRMYQVPSSPILWAAMGSLECPGTNSSDLIPRSNEMLGGYHCLP